MKRFIIKLLIFSLPIIAVLGIYLIKDPFKVLYHYPAFYQSGAPLYVSLNRDYVSMETFNNNHDTCGYDSYIFGNSRSLAFHVQEWNKHIDSHNSFHFDAAGESLYGIEKKMNYLYKKGVKIKNALFVIDYELLKETRNSTSYLFIKHPLLSGQSRLSFQIEFLKTYLDVKFLRAYLDFLISGKVKPYMKSGYIIDDHKYVYDPISNELVRKYLEDMIKSNEDSFYSARSGIFYKRDSERKSSPIVIREEQLKLLSKIKNILSSGSTNFKIIISPLYDQLKLNDKDLGVLYTIFGKNNIYDFSGVNWITNDIHSYYESSHYRPFIANKIMDSIYIS